MQLFFRVYIFYRTLSLTTLFTKGILYIMEKNFLKPENVTRVVVVFKTHLDIGFTDYAKNVLEQYCTSFIPAAVDLAFRVNTPERKQFVWTVGSYLIKYYFDHADPNACEKLSQAIRLGYVRWHGLACTTHTELMDRRLLDYDLSISRSLDEKFGMKTIAAKMTDVPGHTIGLVPALADAGIQYLHLGVNASSRVPEVPDLFLWQCRDKEVIVNYAGDYGDAAILENGTALEFFHAHDNAAPPTPEELAKLYQNLALKYPNAQIEAGTLEDFAQSAIEVRSTLPILTEEIGDTWIHGAATDPLKVSRYRRLLSLKEQWIADGKLNEGSPEYNCLMDNLLLIAEHTWGMDVKKYLLDFTNWDKTSFTVARNNDLTDESSYGATNLALLDGMLAELHHYHGENIRSSYSHFESSHQEQRDYITAALSLLPQELRSQAQEAFAFSYPVIPSSARQHRVFEPIHTDNCTVTIGCHGEITRITDTKSGLNMEMALGKVEYETFGGREVDDCYYDYGRDLKDNYYWSEPDFGKPGLRFCPEIKHHCFAPAVTGIYSLEQTVYVTMNFPEEACTSYGCPREFTMIYHFENEKVHMELYWKEKDAIRSPEALWIHMNPEITSPEKWMMNKSGTPVNPLRVVHDGNRKLHAVQSLVYDGTTCRMEISSADAPLVSPGGKNLYSTDNQLPDLEQGFYFLLCNNRWGTNFKQWFDEDMRFAFDIRYSIIEK